MALQVCSKPSPGRKSKRRGGFQELRVQDGFKTNHRAPLGDAKYKKKKFRKRSILSNFGTFLVREAGLEVHVFHFMYSNPSNLAKYK